MYGNNIKEHPHSTRVFPYIMSKLCDYFSFEQCRFSMSKGKDGTARIAMFKELNISNNFLKAEGAKILVPALEANGSLASLTISNNRIGSEQEAKIKQICAIQSITCTL